MFSGLPRSKKAEQSTEVPLPMIIGMVLLAAACVGLGLAAPLVVPVIGGIAASILHLPPTVFADGVLVIPGDPSRAALSTPLIALLLIGLATVPLMISAAFSSARANRRRAAEPWACGYLPDAHMTVTAHSFAQPIRMFFAPLYAVRRTAAAASKGIEHQFGCLVSFTRRAEPMFDRVLVTPTIGIVSGLGHRVQILQSGGLSTYCLYIVAALAALLLITLR
jgi:hydrogenase-4 component B